MTASLPEKITETAFSVEGMHCASCAAKVEKALLEVPEVITATVNVASGSASVFHRNNSVDPEQVKKAVTAAGYKVRQAKHHSSTHEASLELMKLGIAFICTAPLILEMFVGHNFLPMWTDAVLAGTVVFFSGSTMLWSAVKSLAKLNPNMDVLVATGAISAFGLSVYNWLNDIHGHYFESAAGIVFFVLIGKFLENTVKRKAAKLFERLDSQFPETTVIFVDGREKKIFLPELKVDMVCVIKSGDKIPADGVITSGEAEINESTLTGEALPKFKTPGDEVSGGTICTSGSIMFKVTASPKESLLQKISDAASLASASKPEIQKLVDQISFYFVPVAIGFSALTAIVWMLAGAEAQNAIIAAVSVLVVSCPCALGLATPLALSTGFSVAAKNGIIFRNLAAIENCASLTTVCFDKTGTLTSGEPKLLNMAVFGADKDEATRIASSLAIHSNHPLSKAVVQIAKDQSLSTYAVKYFQEKPGLGLSGKIKERDYILGGAKIMESYKIAVSHIMEEFTGTGNTTGKSLLFLGETHPGRKLISTMLLSDSLRITAKPSIAALKKAKIKSLMITGDQASLAKAIAKSVGIKRIISEVMPFEKADVIKELKSSGEKVGMVGDGVNDAAAIAEADCGFALNDITAGLSAQGATVILLRPDLRLIPKSIKLARRTRSKINQNLIWAFGYNFLAIPAAAFGILNPMMAAMAMSLSSLSVVLNSLSIYFQERGLPNHPESTASAASGHAEDAQQEPSSVVLV